MSRIRNTIRVGAVLLLVFVLGCRGEELPPPIDTGAKNAVRTFYTSLIQHDWPTAYSTLHVVDSKTLSRDTFTKRGQAYCQKLGFEPNSVQVRSCDEHGDEATAHVVLSGPGTKRHQYKDAVKLVRIAGEWRVVVPIAFRGRM